MKINGNHLGVAAPTRVRRKRVGGVFPPWYAEVPPDTVDIALKPRINRYQRGSLKFHNFGNTQRKLSERLALFREAMGEIEPGLAPTRDELMEGLQEVMRTRHELLFGHEDQAIQESTNPGASAGESSDVTALPSSASEEEALSEAVSDVESDVESDDEEPYEGTPTQWLIDRITSMGGDAEPSPEPSPA